MASGKRSVAQGDGAAGPTLPPITTGKFEAIGDLLEAMVAENTSLFTAKGQEYAEVKRQGSSRPLSAGEAMELATAVAAGMQAGDLESDGRTITDRAAAFQQSELRAHDEPQPLELLAAAGVATAPAFMRAARKVVALIELPNTVFEQAYEDGTLDRVVDEASKAMRSVEMGVARVRADAALNHFAAAAGQEAGKGVGLLVRSLWTALEQAAQNMSQSDSRIVSSSSLGSPRSFTGPAGRSSTA